MSSRYLYYNFCYVRLPVEQNQESADFINSSILSFRTRDRFLFDYPSRRPNSPKHNPKIGHSTYLRTRWHSGYSYQAAVATETSKLKVLSDTTHQKRQTIDLLSNDFFSRNSDLPCFLTFTRPEGIRRENIVWYLYSFRALFVLRKSLQYLLIKWLFNFDKIALCLLQELGLPYGPAFKFSRHWFSTCHKQKG